MREGYKYGWPASRLDENDMNLLYRKREEILKPITQLVKEAVNKTYGKQRNEVQDDLDHNSG